MILILFNWKKKKKNNQTQTPLPIRSFKQRIIIQTTIVKRNKKNKINLIEAAEPTAISFSLSPTTKKKNRKNKKIKKKKTQIPKKSWSIITSIDQLDAIFVCHYDDSFMLVRFYDDFHSSTSPILFT